MSLLSFAESVAKSLRHPGLFAAAVVVAHLPFWALSQIYAIERAQVSVDLLIATAVLAWRPALGLMLMVLCWAVDGGVSQSMAYHFLSPAAFLDSARFAGDVRFSAFVSWEVVAGLLLFVGAAWGAWWIARRRRPEWLMTLASIGLVAALDLLNGSSRYAVADRRAVPLNIAGSPIVSFSRQVAAARQHEPPVGLGSGESIAAVADLAGWAQSHPERSIWLIVVESMGWLQDEALRQRLLQQIDGASQGGAYDVEIRRMPFKGATTHGELRALCGVAGAYAELSDAQAADCLPARLSALGWTTHGLHGFSGRMFDRRNWWSRIGLRRTLFLEDLSERLPLCGGSFRGVCDAELLHTAARQLWEPQQFVYTLTLNTHLPLDPVMVPTDWKVACDRANVPLATCELVTAQSRLLVTISGLARELPPPRPLVVVIGDHAPPFLNARARAAFDRGTVPALILRPD